MRSVLQRLSTKQIEDSPEKGQNKQFSLELTALLLLPINRKTSRELNAGSIANAA